jgi:hypothetical protein
MYKSHKKKHQMCSRCPERQQLEAPPDANSCAEAPQLDWMSQIKALHGIKDCATCDAADEPLHFSEHFLWF